VGLALAQKRQGKGGVTACFFGDGAANEGAVHEAMNMAAIWDLPVIFVCENNLYAASTPFKVAFKIENVADRAAAYGMPGVIADGNSIADVEEAIAEAIARARRGEGPTLVECKTYRTRGHSRSDRNRYRSKEEIEEWKARDPIPHFESELMAYGLVTEAEVSAIRESAEAEIAAGIEFARLGTDPNPAEVTRDVYSNEAA
jgi:TPP-dependent pyruvate/acetoin dehydrogenase alpha subunit